METNTETRKKIRRLEILRSLLAVVVVSALSELLEIGVDLSLLCLSAISGILLAGRSIRLAVADRRSSAVRTLLVHLGLWLGFELSCYLATLYTTSSDSTPANWDFLIAQFKDQAYFCIFFYLAGYFSSWLYWRTNLSSTIEALIASAAALILLSGHRNYRLDTPKQIVSQAWKSDLLQSLHAEPQHLLIALSVLFSLLLLFYLISSANRPLTGGPELNYSSESRNWLSALLLPLSLVSLLVLYALHLNRTYLQNIDKVSEGVGNKHQEGKSNLSFHDALGQTNQPAALVRLEGDYSANPWSPMLYFREGALSAFNGREYVQAGAEFDIDVPRIRPEQPYSSLLKDDSNFRENLRQTVYLLQKHEVPFAVDYPLSIRQIVNPDPKKFLLAYQAESYAPTIKPEDLGGQMPGNPRWDAKTLAHYLRAPASLSKQSIAGLQIENDKPLPDENSEDLRYKLLTEQLTVNAVDPLERARAIIDYLSQESVYTRNPRHAANPDPVAPYLFAPPKAKRGYCVHFAHAAVYLLRLAGIPSRIGTGYLTDLNYAKDGHVLLQLGDRHAWPEIYLADLGWTIIDVKPAQAENEQAPVPDGKLLAELMQNLSPPEALLKDPPQLENNDSQRTPVLVSLIQSKQFRFAIYLLLLCLLLSKLWLRYAYLLPFTPERKARLAIRSFKLELLDLGLSRRQGETRWEFSERISSHYALNTKELTQLNELLQYSRSARSWSQEQVSDAIGKWQNSYDKTLLKKLRRKLSVINIFSLLRLGAA